MTPEPTYSEKKSRARKEQKNNAPPVPRRLTRIEKAIETAMPGTTLRPATHQEAMEYLCKILVPGLVDIAVRVRMDAQADSKLAMTKEERKSFSIVWERVSEIVRTRRPRNQDAPLMLIGKLLAETRVISPAEVHVWTTKYFVPGPIAPPH
jgi:hypothetical protein